jgi:hypothetical protein
MAYNTQGVVSYTYPIEAFAFTYLLAIATAETDVGKAVMQDVSAASKVKLAEDGEAIFGRLEVFEDRAVAGIKVGTVSRKFKAKLPAISGHGIIVGDAVCGSATAGSVRKAVVGVDPISNLVVEVIGDEVVVESF